MRRHKQVIAIVVMTTTIVGCSSRGLPAATPTTIADPPAIYATTATAPLVNDLLTVYLDRDILAYPDGTFYPSAMNYQSQLDQLYRGEIPYFATNHIALDSTLWAAPIALDGLAVIVHPDLPINNLSLEQLRAIYQGRMTSWAEVGGDDLPIIPFSREAGSGTRAEFDRMILGLRDVSRQARIAASSELMIQNVLRTTGAIGYVSMGYLAERMKPISVEGIFPNAETITQSTYPLRTTIYVVGLHEPEGVIRSFVGWVQGHEGQAVVNRRYAPLFAQH
jgi:hypothetical protein